MSREGKAEGKGGGGGEEVDSPCVPIDTQPSVRFQDHMRRFSTRQTFWAATPDRRSELTWSFPISIVEQNISAMSGSRASATHDIRGP